MSNVGLTGKQRWRRQPHRLRVNHHDLFYNEGVNDIMNNSAPLRSHSDQTMSQQNSNVISRAWATTGDLNNSGEIIGRGRRLRFNSSVHVILIPTVEEYRTAGLGDEMWWCDSDYKNFKESAVDELRRYLHENSKVDSKMALKHLYQPEKEGSGSDSSGSNVQTLQNSPPTSGKVEIITKESANFSLSSETVAASTMSPIPSVSNHSSIPQSVLSMESNLLTSSTSHRRPSSINSATPPRFSITPVPLIY
mmetsp:Transcript_11481/g.15810  ORF Transcript_11481/g.15810 Transcript_11481/m.15810 type:complete len:250 (-) Transcript_11481:294-1043(-)